MNPTRYRTNGFGRNKNSKRRVSRGKDGIGGRRRLRSWKGCCQGPASLMRRPLVQYTTPSAGLDRCPDTRLYFWRRRPCRRALACTGTQRTTPLFQCRFLSSHRRVCYRRRHAQRPPKSRGRPIRDPDPRCKLLARHESGQATVHCVGGLGGKRFSVSSEHTSCWKEQDP